MSTGRILTNPQPVGATTRAHFYIYDTDLTLPKHQSLVADLENRLTDLGLQGHIGKLGPLKSATDMVKDALCAGARTIVAVGHDKTFSEVINAVAGLDVVLALIPISESNMGKLLGINNHKEGAKILAARKIETINLTRANNIFFLTEACIETNTTINIACNNDYKMVVNHTPATISILNSPQGDQLTCVVTTTEKKWFKSSIKKSTVSASIIQASAIKESFATIENYQKIKLPINFEIIPNALKVIVGKNRLF